MRQCSQLLILHQYCQSVVCAHIGKMHSIVINSLHRFSNGKSCWWQCLVVMDVYDRGVYELLLEIEYEKFLR